MNDADIIKALEHCVSSTGSEACEGCPFNENDICEKEYNSTEKYALDLINRQKAEIERLTEKIEALGDPLEKAHYEISELKAENETLQKAIQVQERMLDNEDYRIDRARAEGRAEGRAEAITEFADRLKKEVLFDSGWGVVQPNVIDQIAKEMKGETK